MAFAGMNYLAIVIAGIAGWIVGAIWYGILGKQWVAALGEATATAMRRPPGTISFYLPFLISFVASLVMAYFLAGVIGHLGPGQVTVRNGIISAVFIWVGFVFTTMLVNNSFTRRSPRLLLIDGGHWLAGLVAEGAVIGAFGA